MVNICDQFVTSRVVSFGHFSCGNLKHHYDNVEENLYVHYNT